MSLIVKSNDDLAQEAFAMQLMECLRDIWHADGVDVALITYHVMAVAPASGFIETCHGALSIHALKKRCGPSGASLKQILIERFGSLVSDDAKRALRNFVRSLAAVSVASYLLQIKDRHNGNMLIDRHGHVIHIDYGFLLTSSPGQLGFESAPFKLTLDMVDVLGGVDSDMFHYFQVLLLRGFLELRRHSRRVLVLVQLMTHGGQLACLADSTGVSAVDALRQRFQLHMTDSECVAHIVDLVSDSLESWSTHAYDYFQYYTNAIH